MESAIIFLVILALFGFFYCLAFGVVEAELLFGKCGFEQVHQLPCPGCGMTRAITAFVRGEIFSAFYIQPGAGIMCTGLVVLGVLSLLTVCFGVNFRFLPPMRRWRALYIVAAVLIIVSLGWLITLSRAL